MANQDFSRRRKRRRRRPSGETLAASSTVTPLAEHGPQEETKPVRQTPAQERDISQELGIRPRYAVFLINPPENFFHWLSERLPSGCRLHVGLPRQPTWGVALYWPESAHSLENALSWVRSRLTDDGAMWVVIPKKRRRDGGDSAITFEVIQQAAQKVGLVDNKTLSLSESEHGIRLVVRR